MPEFLLLIGFVLIMWLFLIRPTSRRQKELRALQSSLAVGDEVMLTSGVYGTVRVVEDDTALVEVADGVTIKVARAAIGSRAPEAPVDEPAEEPVDAPENDEQSGADAGPEEN